ncbi:MAG: aminoglycoside phosphotransferase family protein [Cyanobacteria bacterium P01_A01_bin.84]
MNTSITKTEKNLNHLIDIANRFKPTGKVTNIQEFGSGNINRTFLITLDDSEEKHYILQRINTEVFRQPELVMENMSYFSNHVSQRLKNLSLPPERRWEVPRILLTQEKKNHWVDTDGSFWRAIAFIDTAQTFDTIQNSKHAHEVGYALGMFHNLISDLPPENLADTLPGFHITPNYLQEYNQVLAKTSVSNSPEVKYCLQFINQRQTWAHVLENAVMREDLHLRPIHGDPKVNNVMIDTFTGLGISIIDLDTVKPGLIHYDIGDCLRSGCNSLGEETQDWEQISFDTDICKAILEGYLPISSCFLDKNDYKYIYDGIRLIAFELGLRFFTDYLAGNIYFKTKYREHNLARALVQFKLTQSIESKENAIRTIIQEVE